MQYIKGKKVTPGDTYKRCFWLITLVFIMLAAGIYIFPPENFPIYPKCLWYTITGTHCPGCGVLRGLSLTIHGDLLGLYYQNKLAFIMVPVIIYAYLKLTVKTLFQYELPAIKTNSIETFTITTAICVFWLLRNFITYLAPN